MRVNERVARRRAPKPKIKEGTYYKIHVKGPNNNGERDIYQAVYRNGKWYKRRYYTGINSNDHSSIDRNSPIGYDYELLDNSFVVTEFEEMENQTEEGDEKDKL